MPERIPQSSTETSLSAATSALLASPATSQLATPARRALRGASVGGLGIAVPEGIVTNAPIAERLGVSERWIVERTGIEERRVAAPEERLSDYAAEAGLRALAAAGLEAEALDLVLVATITHEQLSPNAAPLVASRIGAVRAGAIDVGAACSGFVSALALAAGQVESGRAENVLVVGADILSRVTDPDDRSTAALFGDGAGAVVVGAAEHHDGVGPVVFGADGAQGHLIAGDRRQGFMRVKGHDTFRRAVDRLSEVTIEAADAAGRSLAEIDVFAYHQANRRILAAVTDRLKLDPERVIDCIGRFGNTSAATIPLALDDARQRGMLEPGAAVLAAAFGGGLTWAATVIEWGAPGPGAEPPAEVVAEGSRLVQRGESHNGSGGNGR
jgi:3-oxoacyl-[acyl-carrier-protein] synthase III